MTDLNKSNASNTDSTTESQIDRAAIIASKSLSNLGRRKFWLSYYAQRAFMVVGSLMNPIWSMSVRPMVDRWLKHKKP